MTDINALELPAMNWGFDPETVSTPRIINNILWISLAVSILLFSAGTFISNSIESTNTTPVSYLPASFYLCAIGFVLFFVTIFSFISVSNLIKSERHVRRYEARDDYINNVFIPWLKGLGVQRIDRCKVELLLEGEYAKNVVLLHNGVLSTGKLKLSQTEPISRAILGTKQKEDASVEVYIRKVTPVEVVGAVSSTARVLD